MPGLDKEEGCVVQFSYTCVYFRSFPRSRLTWVNNCEVWTQVGSFPNHKGFIKSSAAAEIMTHNYLISGIFVIWLDLQLWRSPGVRTWKTIQLYECNDLKWNLLWDPSELIAVKWSLLWCHDGVSPAFRPDLMFSFSSKRIRVQGFFILYHYIYLYLYSLYLIRDVSGV